MSKIVANSGADSTGGRWLVDVLREARRRGLCSRPYCTTCGSDEFWGAVCAGAAAAAAIESEPVLQGFEQIRAMSALAQELKSISEEDVKTYVDAIRTILIWASDLLPTLNRVDSDGAVLQTTTGSELLYSILMSSPVGMEMWRMAQHSQALRERHAEQRKFELGAAARAEARKLEVARQAQLRAQRKHDRDQRRRDTLARLEVLDDVQRLEEIIAYSHTVPISAIPQELIPKSGLAALTPDKQALLKQAASHLKSWRPLLRSLGF